MTSATSGALAMVSLLCVSNCSADAQQRVLSAEAYGATGDGVTDDGPAIAKMVADALGVNGPVRMDFAHGRTYVVRTAPTRYVFDLTGVSDLTIDGAGCAFVLDPYLRFLSLTHARNTTIRGFAVDFDPLPFVDATVIRVEPDERYLEVALLQEGVQVPIGGPTGEDGEQAFFSMLWYDGPYSTLSHHYWTERIEAGPEPRMARVYAGASFDAFDQVQPGAWRISLPVPRIAHRYGPGACFTINDNDTVTFEDVELWSAPWFGFNVGRNEGTLVFRRVHIRPKPDSGRLMSTWRDGFHVKGNRATLLWEGCVLAGMNDDAYNISTHSSSVTRVGPPTEVEVAQRFPLLHIPWRESSTVRAVDEATGRLLGEARVVAVQVGPEPEPIQGMPAAPVSVLTLDRPIEGLVPGAMVWDPTSCNPDTTLRDCHISMSCRLQSPVRLEGCTVDALLWFYAEGIEGGFPHDVVVRNCLLRRGRGNSTLALVVSGQPSGEEPLRPRAVHDVTLEGNEVWGSVRIEGAERLTLVGNRLMEEGADVALHGNLDVKLGTNEGAAAPE